MGRIRIAFAAALVSFALPPAREAAALEVNRNEDTRTAAPEKIIAPEQPWGVNASAGLMSLSGNAEYEQLTAGLAAYRKWDVYSAYFTAKAASASAFGRSIRELLSATVRADRRISGGLRAFAFTTHSRNTAILVDYRGQLGAGPWYDLKTGPVEHGISLAVAYQYERYSDSTKDINYRLAFRYLLKWKLSETASLGWDYFEAHSFKDFSDVRIAAFPFLEVSVLPRTVYLRVDYGIEHDSQPLAGIKKTDRSLTTSFEVKLGP